MAMSTNGNGQRALRVGAFPLACAGTSGRGCRILAINPNIGPRGGAILVALLGEGPPAVKTNEVTAALLIVEHTKRAGRRFLNAWAIPLRGRVWVAFRYWDRFPADLATPNQSPRGAQRQNIFAI